jgi:hypothetical protein
MMNGIIRIRQIGGVKGLMNALKVFDEKALAELAEKYNFDWHSRKIFFEPFFRALVLYGIDESKGLRNWGFSVKNDPLYRIAGATMEVSVPALSMALANKNPNIFMEILGNLMTEVNRLSSKNRIGRDTTEALKGIESLLTNTEIFDSTTWNLSPKLHDWAKYSDNQAGIRAHLKLNSGYCGVEKLVITSAKDHDNMYFEDFLNLEQDSNRIYLFDCGYMNLTTYDNITDSSNYFVTKLHGSISYKVVKILTNKTKQLSSGWEVYLDEKVTLGNGKNRTKCTYRIVDCRDPYNNKLKILTNMLELPVEKLVLLYQYRWTIEIVFRWLKHSLKLKRFISTSPNGIVIQLLVGLIVYCLLILHNTQNKALSVQKLLNELRIILHEMIFIAGIEMGIMLEREGFQ